MGGKPSTLIEKPLDRDGFAISIENSFKFNCLLALLEIATGLAQSENEKKRQIWDVIQTNASRDLILPNTPNERNL